MSSDLNTMTPGQFKEIRKWLKLSQEKMGIELLRSRSTILKYEAGAEIPDLVVARMRAFMVEIAIQECARFLEEKAKAQIFVPADIDSFIDRIKML